MKTNRRGFVGSLLGLAVPAAAKPIGPQNVVCGHVRWRWQPLVGGSNRGYLLHCLDCWEHAKHYWPKNVQLDVPTMYIPKRSAYLPMLVKEVYVKGCTGPYIAYTPDEFTMMFLS